jgi:glycosyltransferase involved in cell wall biosynthesis
VRRSPARQGRPPVTRRRVVWLVKGLGPGGAEKLLVAAAGAHDRDRFDIEVVYLLPWKNHLVPELEALRVPCTCLEVRDERDVRWAARLRRHLQLRRPDILHSHSPYPAAVGRLVARSLPRSSRPALVSTEHNPWSTFKAPTRYANALTARLDAATFAVSAEARDSMNQRQRARTEVLVHGVAVDEIASLRSERAGVRAELGATDATVLVGTVANYHRKKDWPNLLAAVRILIDRGLPVRVCAVGQGPLEAEVTAYRDELGLQDVVTLTGYRADAVRLMAGCDIFVLGSKWEGLPVALMEASALGLPIVATRVGGIPDAFHDGVDAVLVPPGSPDALATALETLVGDPAERVRLGSAAQARATDFDITRAVRRIETVYDEVAPR